MKDDIDYQLNILAELNYKKAHEGEEDVFPENWYSSDDYYLKNIIIAEALKNNIRIEDTEKYRNEFIEQVKE